MSCLFVVLQQQKMATFYIWVVALLAGALTVNGQGVLRLCSIQIHLPQLYGLRSSRRSQSGYSLSLLLCVLCVIVVHLMLIRSIY